MTPLACRKSCALTPALLKGVHEVSGAMRNAIRESLIAMVQELHERAVWPRSQVPDARVGEIVEFTPSKPRRCYLARQTDAGSVPCSATVYRNFKPYPVGIFWNFPLKRIVASRAPSPQSWRFHPCRHISVLLFLWWSCVRFVPNGLQEIDAGLQFGLAALQFGAHVTQPEQISQSGLWVRKSRLGR
jgi:hypothetical protein